MEAIQMANSRYSDLELLKILKKRFLENMLRHEFISWDQVKEKLINDEKAFKSLHLMEETEGEPDVVVFNDDSKDIIYCDCSKESPKGRRSFCYDNKALISRKKFPPINSALNHAKELGIEILDETMYRKLQEFEPFDLKTSSWVLTPLNIRDNGGAIFCDNRYKHIFTYHNGADSYYGSRGYRGFVKL